jgi:hypothetical protein
MAAQPIRSKVKPNLMAASPLPIESRPTADVLPATASDLDVRPTLKQPHRLQVGAKQLKAWQPRDEFDPEIFNRGQRARTQGTPAAGQSTQPAAEANAATLEPR